MAHKESLPGSRGGVLQQYGPIVLFVLVLAAVPFMPVGRGLYIAIGLAIIYGIAVCGLDIPMGLLRQPILGNFGFAAIGGYVPAILAQHGGLDPWVGLILAILLASLVAVLIGSAMNRVAHVGAALTTFFFGFVIYTLSAGNVLASFTGGAEGLRAPVVGIGPWELGDESVLYFASLLTLAFVAWLSLKIRFSAAGRQMELISHSELVASAFGIPIDRLKVGAFVYSAVTATICGFLLAQFLLYLSPTAFAIQQSLLIFAMVIVGGASTIMGPLFGAVILTLVLQYGSGMGEARELLYAAVVLIALVLLPRGLYPVLTASLGALLSRLRPSPPARTNKLIREASWDSHGQVATRQTGKADAEKSAEIRTVDHSGAQGDRSVLGVRNVDVWFGGNHVLRGVSLDIHHRTIHAIIGPNGAGKTTLLNCLGGTVVSTSGGLLVEGTEVQRPTPQHMFGLGVSRAFQHPSVAPTLTVRQNVQVAAERAGVNDEYVDHVIARVGLTPVAHQLSSSISMAEKKLTDIARAMATRPKILLLDEPTAGLEDYEVLALTPLIREIHEEFDITVILVAHHVGFVRTVASHLTIMDAGSVIATGAIDAVFERKEVVDAFLGSA